MRRTSGRTGRVSMGVIGMSLTDQDEVVGMQVRSQGEYLLVVSENGLGKLTEEWMNSPPRTGAARA